MVLGMDSPEAHAILASQVPDPRGLPSYKDWADSFTGEETAMGQQFKKHLSAWIRAYPFRPNASPQPWCYVSDNSASGVTLNTKYLLPAGL